MAQLLSSVYVCNLQHTGCSRTTRMGPQGALSGRNASFGSPLPTLHRPPVARSSSARAICPKRKPEFLQRREIWGALFGRGPRPIVPGGDQKPVGAERGGDQKPVGAERGRGHYLAEGRVPSSRRRSKTRRGRTGDGRRSKTRRGPNGRGLATREGAPAFETRRASTLPRLQDPSRQLRVATELP